MTLSTGRKIKQSHQEKDRARNMDKRIYTVDPVQKKWMLQKPLLEGHFPKDTESLFQMNQLESMRSSDVDGALDNSNGGKSST